MLRAEPDSYFSKKYTVFEEDEPVARIHHRKRGGKAGELRAGREYYDVTRESSGFGVQRSFRLMRGEIIVATADYKNRIFGPYVASVWVRYGGVSYELEKGGWKPRRVGNVRRQGEDRPVGTIGWAGPLLSRAMVADLPPELPLSVRVFAIMVNLLWSDERSEV